MPRKCEFGCRHNPKIPNHHFPNHKRNPERLEAWLRILGRKLENPEDYEYYSKRVVCDIHFTAADKNRNSRLNILAIPSLHLDYAPKDNHQKPPEPKIDSPKPGNRLITLKQENLQELKLREPKSEPDVGFLPELLDTDDSNPNDEPKIDSPKPGNRLITLKQENLRELKLREPKSEPDVGFLPEFLDTDDSNSNDELLNTSPQTSKDYISKFHACVTKSFQKIAISGLGQESRQELIKKHPVPYNCTEIRAPSLTPEIKATIPEEVIKLDEAIEANQNQLAAAITSLGKVISNQLSNKNTFNSDLVKELMATGHLLCDLQYLQSLTRYNNMSLPRS